VTWLCVVSALPVVVGAAREMAIGWIPEGDDAMLVTRIHDVFSSHPPLQGMRSTSNFFDAQLSNHHPGPLEFYLDAPISALTGYSGPGIITAVALLNIGCVVGTVVLAHRMRGLRTTLPVAGALLLAQWQLGPDVLARPLNPSAGTLPILLMIVGAWSVLDRDPQGLWVTLLAGSFAAQTELAFCPLVVAVVALACIVTVARAWRDHRQWRSPAPSHRSSVRRKRWSLPIGVTLLAWLPSIIELLVIHPNNLQLVLRLLTNSSGGRGTSTGVPGGSGYMVGRLSPTELARFGTDIGHTPAGLAMGLGMVVVVVLLVAATAGPRLPHTAASRACWVLMLAIGAESFALSSKPDTVSATFWLLPVLVITPLVYAALALRAIEVTSSLRRQIDASNLPAIVQRSRTPIVGVSATVLAAVLASAVASPPSAEASDRARTVSNAVTTYLHDHSRSGTAVRIDSYGLKSWISLAPAVAVQLARDDRAAHYLGSWPYPEDNTSWYETTAPPDSVVVTLADNGSMKEAHPGAGATQVPLPPGTGVHLWIAIPAADRA